MLGQSQRAITGLFDTELARLCEHAKTAILLIDEVEALAVSRSEASLKANPVDVHRATDAVLEGLDRAATLYPSLLVIATTNFPQGVDDAFLSRADDVIDFPLPTEPIRLAILQATLREYGCQWPDISKLASDPTLAEVAKLTSNFSGRALRKLVMRAVASDPTIARHPSRLTIDMLENAAKTSSKVSRSDR